ncbi:MAG: beta-lactamase family protein [Lachnospiraceae bacterium]|nr:beta-lactamase family protein [Lachnospiraceae bacterium]
MIGKNKKNRSTIYLGIGMCVVISSGVFLANAGNNKNAIIPAAVRAESVKNNESETADETGILNVASVSKMYVVTAVMQLVDQGRVELDAPVTDYIPDFEMADERYKDITVKMLMNHTSGLMGSVYEGCLLFDEKSTDYHDTFLSKLKKEHLKANPGEFNCYCNDGFTLLEILVERVKGKSFTDYLKENISKPLSLGDTGTMWDSDFDRQIPVYINEKEKLANQIPQLIGAGGIMSDAKDVCRFGTAFFAGDNSLLSENAKKEMANNNKVGDCAESFGLGWDTVEKEDYEKAGIKVLSKGGDTSQHANLLVAPDEKISVAVLSSGGSSTNCEEICLDLLDEALASKGITVEHPEKEVAEQIDVPDKLLKYEGVYATTDKTFCVSFPDKKYMKIVSVTSEDNFEYQYIYTKDEVFVAVSGDVASGNAIPDKPVQEMIFEEKNGQEYLSDCEAGFQAYKVPENKVSEKVQKAWDERDGAYYYLVSGKCSDTGYTDNNRMMIKTSDKAPGYVNGYAMRDENNAGYDVIIPGTASRDISDLRMENVDGKEYICLDALGFRLISEKDIPVFDSGVTSVELKSGEASWFKLDGIKDETIRLDIPDNASVYVYDKYMNIKYSSYMTQYGYSVPLPEYGMIVFIGETGSTVNISQ